MREQRKRAGTEGRDGGLEYTAIVYDRFGGVVEIFMFACVI